jgi:hypothetical protein
MKAKLERELDKLCGHLSPDIKHGTWYEVETSYGIDIVEAEIVGNDPTLEDFIDFCEGEPESFTKCKGWGARMNAAGYMDCTEWSLFKTENEAAEWLIETYGDDA